MQKTTVLLALFLLMLGKSSFSQKTDSTKTTSHFSGSIGITDNGISLIPTFSLNKPAIVFDLSIGKKKLSFEPEFSFSYDSKPWNFLFWWRYKLVHTKKFFMNLGAHPAFAFQTIPVISNGVSKNVLVPQRYFALELTPNYFPGKNVSVGIYYLYSRGLDNNSINITHFLTLNSTVSGIPLGNQLSFRFTPQFYYLKLDTQDGFYFTSSFTVDKKEFPLSVSAIINKTIKTDIVGSKNFVWNVSVIYSFNQTYVKH
ncbi:MAG: hypothetical protein ACHQF0_00105 [Chitinophagales bacterium]